MPILRKPYPVCTSLLTPCLCSIFLFVPLLYLLNASSTTFSVAANSAAHVTPENSSGLSANANRLSVNDTLQKALVSFAQADQQRITILSQSAADPEYASAEKLLSYPAGAWEFEFFLNKKAPYFLYSEAMDAEQLSIYKQGSTVWAKAGASSLTKPPFDSKPSKGWHKIKASQLARPPYNFCQVGTLSQLPFLYLMPEPVLSGPSQKVLYQGKPHYLIKVLPATQPAHKQPPTSWMAPETPQEIFLWISCDPVPRLVKARYFWVSQPPGGTLYTVNEVLFRQN